MIPNKNYNPEKIAEYATEDAKRRYEDKKRRQLSAMAIRNQDPSYRETPDSEGIVDISEGEKE
jgi:hypothetical protein